MLTPLFVVTLAALLLTNQAKPEGDRFGRALLTLHDLDRDGSLDFAVGAPTADGARRNSGHVVILSGASREVLQVWRGEAERDDFGHTLQAAGDANGDGIADVLVGYEFGDRTELRSGTNGAVLHAFDRANHQVIPFGDLDRDGAADFLLVGERLEVRSGRDGSYLSGHVWNPNQGAFLSVGDLDSDGLIDGVLVSKEAKLLRTQARFKGARWSRFDHDARECIESVWGDSFACAGVQVLRAAPAGDLDGDGSQDMLMKVRVEGQSQLWALSLSRAESWLLGSAPRSRALEASSVDSTLVLGDIDGDRCDDLLVTQVQVFESSVVAVSGKTGEGLWSAKWDDEGAYAGISLARLPDMDGDGVDEALVGISDWEWHGTVYRTGRVRCLSGKTGQPLWGLDVDDVRVPAVEER